MYSKYKVALLKNVCSGFGSDVCLHTLVFTTRNPLFLPHLPLYFSSSHLPHTSQHSHLISSLPPPLILIFLFTSSFIHSCHTNISIIQTDYRLSQEVEVNLILQFYLSLISGFPLIALIIINIVLGAILTGR